MQVTALPLATAFADPTDAGAGPVATWVVCHRSEEDIHLVRLHSERVIRLGDMFAALGGAWQIHRKLRGGLEGYWAARAAAQRTAVHQRRCANQYHGTCFAAIADAPLAMANEHTWKPSTEASLIWPGTSGGVVEECGCGCFRLTRPHQPVIYIFRMEHTAPSWWLREHCVPAWCETTCDPGHDRSQFIGPAAQAEIQKRNAVRAARYWKARALEARRETGAVGSASACSATP